MILTNAIFLKNYGVMMAKVRTSANRSRDSCISLRISNETATAIDDLIKNGLYTSRPDFIFSSVRNYVRSVYETYYELNNKLTDECIDQIRKELIIKQLLVKKYVDDIKNTPLCKNYTIQINCLTSAVFKEKVDCVKLKILGIKTNQEFYNYSIIFNLNNEANIKDIIGSVDESITCGELDISTNIMKITNVLK